MNQSYNLSPVLRTLIEFAERELQTEIVLHRRTDVPPQGLMIDDYTFGTGKNVIAFSSAQLGMLKDYTIARFCLQLLIKGMASKRQEYKVLSFSEDTAVTAAKQIYLDILKDECTRNLEVWRKKQLVFLLYVLLHETMSEIPLNLLANLVISHRFPAMRNAQVYFLLKESMRDMHDLIPVKDYLPQRYLVLNNGMYYARDMVLAYSLSEFKLNPVINIPELQRFRNLDMKEMMTQRWSRSPWYHTKMVGDAMSNMMKLTVNLDFSQAFAEEYFHNLFVCAQDIVNRWIVMVGMQDWYVWESPEHLRAAQVSQPAIEKRVREEIFGPD